MGSTLGSPCFGKLPYGICAGLLFTINSRLGFRVWVQGKSQATKVILRLMLQLLHDPLITEKLGNYGIAVYCGNAGGGGGTFDINNMFRLRSSGKFQHDKFRLGVRPSGFRTCVKVGRTYVKA